MPRKPISTRERIRLFQLHERLLEKCIPEPNSGCWLWIGAGTARGYGHMWTGDRFEKAHRLSYLIHCGPIPKGAVVCHRCDVPSCVNPDHLWLGSQADNIRDCVAKGRLRPGAVRGSANVHAKLTEHAVREIRADAGGYGHRIRLARKFGVSAGTIGHIRSNQGWTHT